MNEYGSFAIDMAQKTGIEIEKLVTMTISEIDKIFEEQKEKKILERMQDEVWVKRFRLLMPKYEFLYSHLGDTLIKEFCRKDWQLFIKPHAFYYGDMKDYSEEEKAILFVEGANHWGGKEIRKYSIDTYGLDGPVNKAIQKKYPQLARYNPHVLTYTKPEFENVSLQIPFSADEDGNMITVTISCRLQSLLNFDWEAMLEEYLDYKKLYEITSLDDSRLKEMNRIMNSEQMSEFIETIKSLRQTA